MGYRVSRQEYIRLKQIEKQFGIAAALQEVRSGFVYGEWATLVPNNERNDFSIKMMHWEFIPNFVNSLEDLKLIRKGIDPKTGVRKAAIPWLNAKSENLFTNDKGKKSMWANAARNNRCLIVADHFFEWRHYKPKDSKKDITYPYLIDFYKEGTPMFMAGIYNTWTDRQTGETMDTCAIVTTKANTLMAEIHNTKKRQPTILNEDLSWAWIMEDLTDERILEIAQYQLPSEFMNARTIAKDFLSSPTPLAPFYYPELPVLNATL